MRWWREPLVHFLAVGAVVVAVDAAWSGRPLGLPDARVITVDDALVDDLVARWTETMGRTPTAAERDAAVRQWIDDEILVREARARGLDRDDPVVRARLARKMAVVIEAGEAPEEPTDDQLRALWAAEQDAFTIDERLTVRHLFVAVPGGVPDGAQPPPRAEALLARVQAGEDPRIVDADPPPGGPVLRGRTPERLTELFGAAFTGAVQAAGTDWTLAPSPEGWHVVRVEQRQQGRTLGFDEARDRVALRWRARRIAALEDQALDALRDDYAVVGWPP